jgi:hypothetical protein
MRLRRESGHDNPAPPSAGSKIAPLPLRAERQPHVSFRFIVLILRRRKDVVNAGVAARLSYFLCGARVAKRCKKRKDSENKDPRH